MARKFLYFIAFVILLIFVVLMVLRLFPDTLARAAFVPATKFEAPVAAPPNRYADLDMWFSRRGVPNDPALWLPSQSLPGAETKGDPARPGQASLIPTARAAAPAAEAGLVGNAAVFFIHPTSYLSRSSWNAPLDDPDANDRARLFLRGMASAFNRVGEVWAPRYRQATLGAFLTDDQATADMAFDVAYQDIALAFDYFLAQQPAGRPIILAGHSQGSLHLTRLMKEKVAGQPVARRIVAAYVVGWPVSIDTDLAALGLPACAAPDQAGCVLAWQSFAEPAGAGTIFAAYDATTGFNGQPRAGTRMLCVNPLTGTQDAVAEAGGNLGSLKPNGDFTDAELIVGAVPARCDAERGLLLIGPGPDLGGYVLPGNNYHVYDYPLFWMNVRADVARRLAVFEGR